MRRLLFLAMILGILWAVDNYYSRGRYTDAVLEQLKYQAQAFNKQVEEVLRKMSP